MANQDSLSKAALAGVMSLGIAAASQSVVAGGPSWAKKGTKVEKCLGVAKKGKNDCGHVLKVHSCAKQSTKDNDPYEWIYTPENVCDKIGGTVWMTKTVD